MQNRNARVPFEVIAVKRQDLLYAVSLHRGNKMRIMHLPAGHLLLFYKLSPVIGNARCSLQQTEQAAQPSHLRVNRIGFPAQAASIYAWPRRNRPELDEILPDDVKVGALFHQFVNGSRRYGMFRVRRLHQAQQDIAIG